MAPKAAAKTAKAAKAATDDELDKLLFEGIDKKKTSSAKPKTPSSATKPKTDLDGDILADLEHQLDEKPVRPNTPRIREVKRSATGTPPPAAERASEEKPTTTAAARKSAESTRASFTPSATSSDAQESEKKEATPTGAAPAAAAGGSWWGGFLATATATASAAMKQAETTIGHIQTEDAKKWAEQVRGNVGAIRGYVGEEIRHRGLPTFSDILHTLAPPIASHERLSIHITHDLVGYPSLDPLVHAVFSRVMAQVEGGDLMVIQRGHENAVRPSSSDSGAGETNRRRSSSAAAAFFSASQSTYGWRDGPWWRVVDAPRDMGVVKGLTEGTKLCRASAEGYADEYFAATGGLDQARQRAAEDVSESNPVRRSDLFLALQAVGVDGDEALFAGPAAAEKAKADSAVAEHPEDDRRGAEQIVFAVYVFDPVHEITYHTVSQAVPAQWVRWLDAGAPLTPASSGGGPGAGGPEENNGPQEHQQHLSPQAFLERVPDEIRDVVESGGVDPREWVAEWLEEILNLSIGVVAQRYVARRMGVGEGGIGKGKRRMELLVQDNAGEAARAGLI